MFSSFPDKAQSIALVFNIVSRYLLFTGLAYLFLYVWRKRRYWLAKIQQRYPEPKQVLNEIKNSFITMSIFGVVILLNIWAGNKGLTMLYTPADKYGYGYY